MQLEITKGHFDKAAKQTRYHTSNCLVAQAMKAAFPGKRVDVNYHFASAGKRTFALPKSLSRLIARFDNSVYVDASLRTKGEEKRALKIRESLPLTFELKEI